MNRTFPNALLRLAVRAAIVLAVCTTTAATTPAAHAASAPDDSVLAVYRGGAVYPHEFARAWRGLSAEQRDTDDLLAKKREFLRRVVDRELLAQAALARPFTFTPQESVAYLKRRAAYLQYAYLTELRRREPPPTETDMQLFVRQNRELAEYRVITFADMQSARSWRQRLLRGVPVSVLESAIQEGGPNAPVAAPAQGVGAEQLPDTIAARIWKMRPGELSDIIDNNGKPAMFHVLSFVPRTSPVRLDDPNEVREEFEKRQLERVRRDYRLKLHQELRVTYDQQNMGYLLDRYIQTTPERSGFDPVQNIPTYRLTMPMPQLAFDDSTRLLAWTARGDTLRMAKYLVFWNEQPAQSRPEIRTPEALTAAVDRVLFDDVLVERALAAGLDRDSTVIAELARARESVALDHWYRDEVWNQVDMSPANVQKYFDSRPGHYDDVEQVKPRIILLQRESEADSIKARLEAGESFSELAEKYSWHGVSAAKGGALGVVTRADNITGNVAAVESMMKTPVGKIGGPESTPEGWLVWIVDEHFPAKKRPLSDPEVKRAAERDYQVIESEKILGAKLEEMQAKANVQYFDERITKDLGADPGLGIN
jgi:parvulin-like peptidyl-prolyl isomerase